MDGGGGRDAVALLSLQERLQMRLPSIGIFDEPEFDVGMGYCCPVGVSFPILDLISLCKLFHFSYFSFCWVFFV